MLMGLSAADAAAFAQRLAGCSASVLQPVGLVAICWMQDPWTLGAYSFNALGMREGSRCQLERPINGRQHLAGEHTHASHYDTVHGVYVSSLRAARQVAALARGD